MIATRLAWLDSAKRCSISKGVAISSAKRCRSAVRSAPATGSKTMRMKNRPSAVECWSASTMLRPASARKPLTRAINPGRSGQASSSRVVG